MSRHKIVMGSDIIKRAGSSRSPSVDSNLSRGMPERFSSIDDVTAHFRNRREDLPIVNTISRLGAMRCTTVESADDHAAVEILETAKKMGVRLENLGDTSEVEATIKRTARKLLDKNRGYDNAVYAVASIVLAKNDMDTAIRIIENMASKMDEGIKGKEPRTHLNNMSDIMKLAKELSLDINKLSSVRPEETADEILRVATHARYNNPKNGIAIVALGQKAEGTIDLVVNQIVPRCNGSELYLLNSFVNGMMNSFRKKLTEAEGVKLLEAIRSKLKEISGLEQVA